MEELIGRMEDDATTLPVTKPTTPKASPAMKSTYTGDSILKPSRANSVKSEEQEECGDGFNKYIGNSFLKSLTMEACLLRFFYIYIYVD